MRELSGQRGQTERLGTIYDGAQIHCLIEGLPASSGLCSAAGAHQDRMHLGRRWLAAACIEDLPDWRRCHPRSRLGWSGASPARKTEAKPPIRGPKDLSVRWCHVCLRADGTTQTSPT